MASNTSYCSQIFEVGTEVACDRRISLDIFGWNAILSTLNLNGINFLISLNWAVTLQCFWAVDSDETSQPGHCASCSDSTMLEKVPWEDGFYHAAPVVLAANKKQEETAMNQDPPTRKRRQDWFLLHLEIQILSVGSLWNKETSCLTFSPKEVLVAMPKSISAATKQCGNLKTVDNYILLSHLMFISCSVQNS